MRIHLNWTHGKMVGRWVFYDIQYFMIYVFRSRFVINLCSFEVQPKLFRRPKFNQNSSDDQISTKNIFRPNFDKKYIPNKFWHNTFGRHFRPQFHWSQLGWLTPVREEKIAISVHCPQFEVRVRSISTSSLGFPLRNIIVSWFMIPCFEEWTHH